MSVVGVVELEPMTSKAMSEIIVQNQELAIATTNITYASIGDIL